MNFFRRKHNSIKLVWTIALAVVLRSLIAPGFMLDTKSTDGGLPSIILCEGPAGINAIPGLVQIDNHHHHSGDHDEQHQHDQNDHSFLGCSLWSATSYSNVATLSFIDLTLDINLGEVIDYELLLPPSFTYNTYSTRAPPILFLI